jgi:hypothetical protein
VLVSFVYVVACRLFALVSLFARSDRSKELELFVLVEYVACTTNPETAWMSQQARKLLMDLDDRRQRPRFLIPDRDTKLSWPFDSIFVDAAWSSSLTRSEGVSDELPRIAVCCCPTTSGSLIHRRQSLGRARGSSLRRTSPSPRPPRGSRYAFRGGQQD